MIVFVFKQIQVHSLANGTVAFIIVQVTFRLVQVADG